MTNCRAMFSLLLVMTLAMGCSIDRNIKSLSEPERDTLKRFKTFSQENQLKICDDNEPGQRLVLCLTFISKENKKPLPNLNVHLYHTSTDGQYNPSDINDETTARLNGNVITNNKGEAFVETILPGDYGSSADNRHIHTTVDSAGPKAYDIHFKQYTGRMGKNFIRRSDQHFLADLKQTDDKTLVAFVTMEVKNVTISLNNNSPDSNQPKTIITGERDDKERPKKGPRLIAYDSSYWSSPSFNALQDSVVDFATSFLGTPYRVAGQDENGFDCSGYVYFVFQHFNVTVPRSSRNYRNFGVEVPIEHVQKGDVLVFLSPTRNEIGHVGIVSKAEGRKSEFLHATSGKKKQVVVTNLKSRTYKRRFVKAIRVLPRR